MPFATMLVPARSSQDACLVCIWAFVSKPQADIEDPWGYKLCLSQKILLPISPLKQSSSYNQWESNLAQKFPQKGNSSHRKTAQRFSLSSLAPSSSLAKCKIGSMPFSADLWGSVSAKCCFCLIHCLHHLEETRFSGRPILYFPQIRWQHLRIACAERGAPDFCC